MTKDYKKAYEILRDNLYDDYKRRDAMDSCNCEWIAEQALEAGEITVEQYEMDNIPPRYKCEYCAVIDVFDEYEDGDV